jgi:L-iditol 2-dehydrogenase
VTLAKALGAGKIIVLDINDFRVDFAKKYDNVQAFNSMTESNLIKKIQSVTGYRGVDISIVATGSAKALEQSFDVTRKAGKVMLFGVPSKGSEIPVNVNKLYANEQSIIPTYAASEIETNQALKLIVEKRLDVKSLITHRFDIKNTDVAIRCADEAKDSMKVIVTSE